MYINESNYRNVGPIGQLDLTFRRNTAGIPVPVIIVGKNGSGKSIVLSNIVDAFYEIASEEYGNVSPSSGNRHPYYKTISPNQIRIGEKYMIAYLQFEQKDKHIEYIYKSGDIVFDNFMSTLSHTLSSDLNWRNENNYKNISIQKDLITDIFDKNIVCFFGPNRYMKPEWMGGNYSEQENMETYSFLPRMQGVLKNPITATNIPELTLQWLCDIITDSRADLIKKKDGSYSIVSPSINDLDLLSISRNNAEKIMSTILGEEIIFRMGNRAARGRRFRICKTTGEEIAPSLYSLSTGQLALFHLFATIIRYADNDDINFSHRLSEIEGIVIIDEIELHLHAELQRKALPKLIALFPKVQFIITSHAPLFLLGMREQFGEENFDIYEMPLGHKISAEQFSEFGNAYQYLTETNRYQKEIADEIDKRREKPLIITEGATDWKHIKAARQALMSHPSCKEWLPALEFDFLEYEPKNSDINGAIKLEMSADQLKAMCEQHALMPQLRKLIFIADRDKPDITKRLGGQGKYVDWGNNVYSLCIPVPSHRESTPNICIEHLYSDQDIKREVPFEDGIKRRIYMGNEFTENGYLIAGRDFSCTDSNCCGPEKINIIDGSGKKKVYEVKDSTEKNRALSKMCFATYILEKRKPFEEMDFTGFIPLFEIIRDILKISGEADAVIN